MELVTPGIGLIFWQTVTFLIVLFLLSKFAWKPIMKALHDREASIENALKTAERAKLEMEALQADNKKLMNEARLERDVMLKEASVAASEMMEAAKKKATEEGNRLIELARETIENEKRAAILEVKNMAGALSVDIAERILGSELNDPKAQHALAQRYISEVNLN